MRRRQLDSVSGSDLDDHDMVHAQMPSLWTRMFNAMQKKLERTYLVKIKTNDGRKVPSKVYRKEGKRPSSTKNHTEVFFPAVHAHPRGQLD